ncbi:hypothetical protein G9464_11790 [Halostella sp. JP-L12]|uniref:hypothetical protein n=1 Tax=Halostella TaxID=1843185 RepID=UPI000EF7F564|nr:MULTISPECIES: hypothetical protein [Halostella]NHN48278.1 hypothetical protein [Halostella sp. JP-L12]
MDSESRGPLASARSAVAAVPWQSLAVDIVLVVAWVAATSFAFRAMGWPNWLYYVTVFGGVLAYSLAVSR